MRKLSLLVVLVACMLDANAQTCKQKAPPSDVRKMTELVGEWRGQFTAGRLTYPVSFKLYEENQELKVLITNTGQVPGEVLADVSLCSTNKFHFFGQRVGGESFAYNARLVNGELVGDLTIGDNCSKENRSTFKLHKRKA